MTELQTLEHKIARLPNELKPKLEGYIDALLEEAWTLKHESMFSTGEVDLTANEINGPLDEFKAYSY